MTQLKRLLIASLLLFSVATAWGQVNVSPPTVSGTQFDDQINNEILGAVEQFEAELSSELEQFFDQPLLAQGIANSGATATHIGTQRAFIDYRRFALVAGVGFAASLPDSDPSAIEESVERLEEDGDLYAGAAFLPVIGIGVPLRFLSEDLYVNFKLSWFESEGLFDGFEYNSFSIGGLVNYQLLETRSLPLGFLRWRGLSVGSGVIYQRNELVYELGFDRVTETVDFGTVDVGAETVNIGTADITMEPTITAVVGSNSVVIPLEATTGLRILWLFDVNIGAGIDLAFGNSEVELELESPVTLEPDGTLQDLQVTDGSATVTVGTDGDGPDFIRPRLTAGVGLNLGPLKVDVPLMYYFDSDGNSLMAGVNVGIVW
ncbi:MAG: hypothetical protein MI724_10105 [Spirochaetales bacterium]|nr:hypothetical protein [Spirochaetales bacterium]